MAWEIDGYDGTVTGNRYLEAAPATWNGGASDPTFRYGGYGTTTGTTSTAIGTGEANTRNIVAAYGDTDPYTPYEEYAAKECDDLILGGFSDWFFPSKDELNLMYIRKTTIGDFTDNVYICSTEISSTKMDIQQFSNGTPSDGFKSNLYLVRPIRAF